MANLYLLDKPYGENGLALAEIDKDAKVALLQDGVYLNTIAVNKNGAAVYAIKSDVEKRGLTGKLPGYVKVIDYGELVDLIVDNKVVNFT